MYELIITISLAILFTFFAFIFSHIMMKRYSITHPKNKFWIYAMVMMTAFSIFSFSFIAVSDSILNYNQSDTLINESEAEYCSVVMVIEETGIEDYEPPLINDGYSRTDLPSMSSINIKNKRYTPVYRSITFLSHFTEQQSELISQIFPGYQNDLPYISNSINPAEGEAIISSLFNDATEQGSENDNNIYVSFFLILNLLLLIICVFYLILSFAVGKIFILKNFNAMECNDPEVLKIVESLSQELKIKMIKVFVYDGAPNAFVFGFPTSLAISKELIHCLSKKELCMAIRHELAHIKNKDLIIKPVLQALRILFFYNPIVHLLYYKMIKERELMADSSFIKSKEEKITLIEMLMKIHKCTNRQKLLSQTLCNSYSLSLLSHNFNKLDIKDRYNHLFRSNVKKSFYSALICLIIIISNISMIAVAKNVLDNSDQVYVEEKISMDDLNFEEHTCSHPLKYIFRVIENHHPEVYKKYIIYLIRLDIQKENFTTKDLFKTINFLLND